MTIPLLTVVSEFDFQTVSPDRNGHISVLSATKVQNQQPKGTPLVIQEKAEQVVQSISLDLTAHKVQQLQRNDPEYRDMITFLESRRLPSDPKLVSKIQKTYTMYFLNDGLLYHVWVPAGRGEKLSHSHVQLAIPCQLVQTILVEAHDSPLAGGHMGISRTMDKVRAHYFRPSMYRDVVQWVKSCIPCNQRKEPPAKDRAQLIPIPVPNAPFERVSTDILGPLPTCRNSGNKYVVVFVDYFTKYMELIALPNIKAETVAWAFIEEVVCRHGTPAYLHSNRGTNYLSNIVQATCKILQVTKT